MLLKLNDVQIVKVRVALGVRKQLLAGFHFSS